MRTFLVIKLFLENLALQSILTNVVFGLYSDPGARYSLKSNHQFPSVGPSTVLDDQLTVSSGSGPSSPGPATPLSASVEEDMIFPVSAGELLLSLLATSNINYKWIRFGYFYYFEHFAETSLSL